MSTAALKPLEPADLEHCQAEITSYNPWILGGSCHRVQQCAKQPHWLATEAKPDEHGRYGAMSVCDECAAVMVQKMAPDSFTLDWIVR